MPAQRQPDRWWVVAAAGLAVFMALLDTFVVNVALPTIQAHFATTTAAAEWVVLGYTVPLVALALPGGRWLDQVGARAALTVAALGFAAASVAAGLAPGLWWLVAARIVQGSFAAVLLALTPVLATVAVRPAVRGRAMGVVTALGPLGAISGPPLGGLLLETLGWPWIFFLNVPVSLLIVALGVRQLPAGDPLRLPDRAWLAEAGLLGGATLAVVAALSLAGRDLRLLVVGLLAAPAVLVWLRWDRSQGPRALWRTPGLGTAHIALLANTTAFGAVLLIVPFYLHQVVGMRPGQTGLTILAAPVAMALGGPLSGWLTDRRRPLPVAIVGAALMTAGLAVLAPLGSHWTAGDVAWRLAIVGAGSALFNTAATTFAMTAAGRRERPPVYRLRATRRPVRSRPTHRGGQMIDPVRTAVINYSSTGNVHALASAVAEGAAKVGAETGNPYGASHVSPDGSSPDEDAHHQGRRCVEVAAALTAGAWSAR